MGVSLHDLITTSTSSFICTMSPVDLTVMFSPHSIIEPLLALLRLFKHLLPPLLAYHWTLWAPLVVTSSTATPTSLVRIMRRSPDRRAIITYAAFILLAESPLEAPGRGFLPCSSIA